MKYKTYLNTLLFAWVCIPTIAFAHADIFNTVTEILNNTIKPNEPGCSVVVTDGVNSYFNAKGLASLEYGTSLTPDTKMLTASTSKQFLGYAVLQLVKQGKLNLDDNLEKYIPEFTNFTDIKVYQLLNHTSGVKSHWAIFELMGKSLFDEYQPELVTDVLQSSIVDFAANSRYLYSNGGYFLLTKVVESVTKKSFHQYMKQEVFKKVGMNNTEYLDDYKRIIENRADGYMIEESGNFVAMRTHSNIIGPGHIVTTARDFSTWANHLLNLNITAFFEPLTPYVKSTNGGDVNYFAGLFKETLNGDLVYQHAGYYENWRQGFSVYPDKQLSITSLCNRADISTNKMNYEIAAALLNWADVDKSESDNKSKNDNSDVDKVSLLKSFAGTYFNKTLNEIIDIRFHKGSLYYVSPANSAYAKLFYDSENMLFKDVGFKQNNTFSFSTNTLIFNSTILSGEFEKLVFEPEVKMSSKHFGQYTSEDGVGGITLSKSETGILIKIDKIGEIAYLHTKGKIWLDQENLSTLSIASQGDKTLLSLSLKNIKNLRFTKSNR
ncbi:MAG: beta-lactamase family protein [Colwellia sp.]|nr:beta-lactamase family protein [Colwellia sp.]